MKTPKDYVSIDEALKKLPPEMRAQIEPAIQSGNPLAFIGVLKVAHRQLGDFIEKFEANRKSIKEVKLDPSVDPGTRGEQGHPRKE